MEREDEEKGNRKMKKTTLEDEAKIAELQSNIERLTGSAAELRLSMKELETQSAADMKALAEKQHAEFHDAEKDFIQAIENLKAALTENLKAALTELATHHEASPECTVDGGAIFKNGRDPSSFGKVVEVPAREQIQMPMVPKQQKFVDVSQKSEEEDVWIVGMCRGCRRLLADLSLRERGHRRKKWSQEWCKACQAAD